MEFLRNVRVDPSAQTMLTYGPPKEEQEEKSDAPKSIPGDSLEQFCKKMRLNPEQLRRWVYIHNAHKLGSKSDEEMTDGTRTAILGDELEDLNYVYPDPLPMRTWSTSDFQSKFHCMIVEAINSWTRLRSHNEKTDGTRMEMATWSVQKIQSKFGMNFLQAETWLTMLKAQVQKREDEIAHASAIPGDELEQDSNYVYPDPLPMTTWFPDVQHKFAKTNRREDLTLTEKLTLLVEISNELKSIIHLKAHNEKTDGTRLEMATWSLQKIQSKFGMSSLQAETWLKMLKAQNQKREDEMAHASAIVLGGKLEHTHSGSNYVNRDPLPMSTWHMDEIHAEFQTGLLEAMTSLTLLGAYDEKKDGTRMEMASWSLQKIQKKFRMNLLQADTWLAMLRADNRKREGVQEKDATGKAFGDSLVDICEDYQLTLEEAYHLVNLRNKQRIFDELEEMKKNGARTATHREDLEATLRLFRLSDDDDVHVHINTDPFSDVNVKVIDGLEMDGIEILSIIEKVFGSGAPDVTMKMSEEKDGVTLWYATGGIKTDKGVFTMTTTAELTRSVYHCVADKGIPIEETTVDLLQVHLSLGGGTYFGVDGGVNLVKISDGIVTKKVGFETGLGIGIKDDSLDIDVCGVDVTIGKNTGAFFWGNGESINFGNLFAYGPGKWSHLWY